MKHYGFNVNQSNINFKNLRKTGTRLYEKRPRSNLYPSPLPILALQMPKRRLTREPNQLNPTPKSETQKNNITTHLITWGEKNSQIKLAKQK